MMAELDESGFSFRRALEREAAALNDLASRSKAFWPYEESYSWRVAIGSSYRADMWALIERSPELTPAELARRAYGSFPSAWEARRDWLILHPEDAAKGSPAASDAEATAALGRSRMKLGKALKNLA